MATKLTPPVNRTDHVKGPASASVELVEYGDFECPHCAAAYPIVKEIESVFGKSLKFGFRHFPLREVHPYAEIAAVAAEAAGRQNKFWNMHDMIYEHQSELDVQALLQFAEDLNLDIVQFEKDMRNGELIEKVEADFESGIRSGVNGTPSFFINGFRYNGAYDFDSLASAIRHATTAGHFH
jgi:protein-disulfide isomerase